MDYSDARQELIDWLKRQLIGPASKDSLTGISPLDRYPCGVLFPVTDTEGGLDPAADSEGEPDDADATDDEAEEQAQTAARRRYVPPSAVGFSFFVRDGEWQFHVRFSAARYERKKHRDESGRYAKAEYERIPLGGDEEAVTFSSSGVVRSKDVMGGKAGIDVRARSHAGGQIITVSLFNKENLEEYSQTQHGRYWESRCEKSLFEVKLSCHIEKGEIGSYPRVEYSLLGEEEQEQELRYRSRKIYAIGHGAAVNWEAQQGAVTKIFSDFIPTVEVPDHKAAEVADHVLEFEYLSTLVENTQAVCADLSKFVANYKNWVAGQQKQADDLDDPEKQAGRRITDRMQTAVNRMNDGIELLQRDGQAAKAFAVANRVMRHQMLRGNMDESGKALEKPRWRAFQLAFLLATIESAIDEDSEYRDVVDLIWFPTGGGKTEAYLGLIAYLAVWRRLKFPETGGGTTTLMRYTLRLLTVQQYRRAIRMICALELVRRRDPSLGKEPITAGLWVGEAASPNTFTRAKEIVERASQGNVDEAAKLVLCECPWCDQKFEAPASYIATETSFHFRCTNSECDLGRESPGIIPCNVVDQALYESPPTLLLATVDKFARLAWEERATGFFGKYGEITSRPPELVIQDELHLIAGALGSVAGLYEAALHTVLVNRGVNPKYVASTATIRMADEQVRRLYGSDVAIFPPPGLDCDDSYFARTVPVSEKPGRLYLGYFAPALNRQLCMSPLAAALLVAPEAVFGAYVQDRSDMMDAWWTNIVYHGSLKGVGNSHNAFQADVRERSKRLQEEVRKPMEERDSNMVDESQSQFRDRSGNLRIDQITSIASAEENVRTFARLKLDHAQSDALDAALVTNMVSVGLDVGRLALMVVNGQPLTTAEYIQASSRVGRSEIPGIVCANYYRDQARSLSHYENFRPYHESFYRFVEPTSVTPFTWQARRRALHAALVIAVRHSCPSLLGNDQAGKFCRDDDMIRKVVDGLKRRCARADQRRAGKVRDHIDLLVDEWHSRAEYGHKEDMQFKYNSSDRAHDQLLYSHGDKNEGLWLTPQSMRNIENSGLLKLL